MSVVIPALLSGLCVLSFIVYLAEKRKLSTENRVQKYAVELLPGDSEKPPHTGVFRSLLWEKWLKRVEKEMAHADIPLKPQEYLIFQILATTLPPLAILARTHDLMLAVEWIALSLLAPLLLLQRAKSKRLTAFERQMGDTLGTMANSLRAGFGFQQAMEMIAKESSPPISIEMSRALRETNLGVSTEEALHHMAGRVNSRDLELMVTAVIIQRQVGGNLAEVLERISHTIRERARIRGEIKTFTAQGRISGLVIGSLPFALAAFLLAVNPSYLGQLFRHPLGIAMIIAGLTLEVIGFVIIRKIVSIEM